MIDFGFLANALFSVSLSILYVLLIRFNAPEAKLNNVFYWMRIIVWSTCIVYCSVFVATGNYNPLFAYCWNTIDPVDGDIAADAVNPFVMSFSIYAPLAVQIITFGWLYRSVYETESSLENRRSTLTDFPSSQTSSIHNTNTSGAGLDATPQAPATVNRSKSKAVVVRALLYNLGYSLFSLILVICMIIEKWFDVHAPIGVYLALDTLYCSQGIWMLLAFMLNRKMLTREGKFVKSSLCCCLYNRERDSMLSHSSSIRQISASSSGWGKTSRILSDVSERHRNRSEEQTEERPVSGEVGCTNGECPMSEKGKGPDTATSHDDDSLFSSDSSQERVVVDHV
eukprot:Nitzschia sp. Nitz4//scaffold100_size80364//74758//75777//NITZ4_005352-RA/size80364-processed-gene-0.57-mRNA-1//-1//CDS//3329532118//5067//frame0